MKEVRKPVNLRKPVDLKKDKEGLRSCQFEKRQKRVENSLI